MLSEIYNVQYCLNCGFCFVMKFCCGTCICTYCGTPFGKQCTGVYPTINLLPAVIPKIKSLATNSLSSEKFRVWESFREI
jgi:hypothetical protein